MTLHIQDGEFYKVRLPNTETLHSTREDALDFLRENATDLSAENKNVSVVKVNVSGDDWQIKELSWQSVALELLSGGDV